MKEGKRHFRYMLMLTLITSTMYAQTLVKDKGAQQQDLITKYLKSSYSPRVVSWWDSGNGFIYKSTGETNAYLTRFDKQGNYVETLKRKIWNDSSLLQPSFQQSQYKQHRVISYWEVSDVNKKGYYLEMSDSKNQSSSVWVDDLGKFSIIPSVKIKTIDKKN